MWRSGGKPGEGSWSEKQDHSEVGEITDTQEGNAINSLVIVQNAGEEFVRDRQN